MTIQYNVNLIGSLTNTNGVLSGFSVNSNYATFSGDTFNDTDVEIVFKAKFNRVTSDDQICYSFYDSTKTYSLCDIGLTGDKFYFEITNGTASLGDISGTTTVIANTDYYIKAVRNNTTYTLYSSTNGTNWTTEGTLSNITSPSYTSATNYIGGFAYDDNGFAIDQILDGTVDLNESYIKVGGQYLWRGVTNITTIQLRHDTAANWTSVNPILLEGEVGIETDTGKSKFGDGLTSWNNLPYNAGSIAATALNSKADTDLSNLSATGQNIVDTVKDQSTNTRLKYWTGTQAQYDAIVTKDNDTIYNVEDTSSPIINILDTLYPVGAIYIGTMATCPLSVLGIGTWQIVAQDRVLQGAGTRGSVGTTINESLPNIKGNLGTNWQTALGGLSGAFYTNPNATSNANTISGSNSNGVLFDASRSSSSYQDNAPVQQDGYLVNIWERIL